MSKYQKLFAEGFDRNFSADEMTRILQTLRNMNVNRVNELFRISDGLELKSIHSTDEYYLSDNKITGIFKATLVDDGFEDDGIVNRQKAIVYISYNFTNHKFEASV